MVTPLDFLARAYTGRRPGPQLRKRTRQIGEVLLRRGAHKQAERDRGCAERLLRGGGGEAPLVAMRDVGRLKSVVEKAGGVIVEGRGAAIRSAGKTEVEEGLRGRDGVRAAGCGCVEERPGGLEENRSREVGRERRGQRGWGVEELRQKGGHEHSALGPGCRMSADDMTWKEN